MPSVRQVDVDRGWAWPVLVAVYSGRVLLSTSLYMSGVFYIALLEYFHDDLAKTSIIGSLNSGLLCLFGPFVSLIIDAYSCRVSMVIGGFLLSLSYFISAFVDNVDYLIVTLGVLGGIANSMVAVPFSVTLAYYFKKRRNIVISLSVAVIGLAMFIASPFALYLLDNYGLKGTFMIVGALNAQLCVCGMMCKPSSEELSIRHKKRTIEAKEIKIIIKNKFGILQIFNINICKNLSFMMFLLSTSTWNFMLSVCLMHLPNYIITKGFPASAITLIMTTFGVSNTLGRFLSALTVGRGGIDSLTLYVGMLGVAGVATLTFPLYSGLNYAGYIYAVVTGFYTGGPNSVMTPITLRLVDADQMSSALGLELFFCGIGVVAGPPIAGILYEATDSYESSFMVSGIIVLGGCFLAMLSSVWSPPVKAGDIKDEITMRVVDECQHLPINTELLENDNLIEINMTTQADHMMLETETVCSDCG